MLLPAGIVALVPVAQSQATEPETWFTVVSAVAVGLGGLFVWLVRTWGKDLLKLIAQKSGSSFLAEVAQRALVVVLHAWQTEARHLKGTVAWTEEAKLGLKKRAMDHLAMLLDPEATRRAAGEIGVEAFLEHQIEAAVVNAKTVGKAAKAAATVNPPPPPA